MTQLIDGKKIAAQIKDEVKYDVDKLRSRGKRNLPCRHTGGA